MNRGSSCLVAGLALLAASTSAFAQAAFPMRPIRVIVPYPAGGIVDIVARSVTDTVAKNFRQPMVVEAKPGGNSNIGTAEVARSAPDGYTWLVTGPAVLVNPSIYKDAGWNAMRDFKCVGLVVWNQSAAVVPVNLPVKTLKDFVDLAKAKPGQLNFGNPGIGSSIDLTAKNLFRIAGINIANRLQGPAAGLDRPHHQRNTDQRGFAGAGAAAYQGRQTEGACGFHQGAGEAIA
jgi:tripartite-type tricarboxylate transporter receptor subunit TctC